MEEIKTNGQQSPSVNDLITQFEEVFLNNDYFKGKLSYKNKFVYFDDKRLNWKNDKSLFRSIVSRELDIKKTEIDYDILFVALLHVAKQNKLEDTDDIIVAPNYSSEFLDIESLIDEIENDDTLSDEVNDWTAYRNWKNNEAVKIVNTEGEVTGFDSCYDNIVGWLEHFPLTKGKIKYNDKSNRVDIWGEIYDDNTVYTIMGYLNKYFIRRYSSVKGLNEAIKGCANSHHYDPFKDYIESLKYDDSKDWIEYLLTDVLKVEMWEEYSELYKAELRMWLYAAIKRVYEPGCKFDNILVFVSQNGGTGKTSAIENLFNVDGQSYSKIVDASQQINMNDRFFQQCASNVCINFDEVAMKSANVNKIKTMLTQQNDEWHTLYAVADAPTKRSFVFAGSTNNTDFLKDYSTMFERRWWIIKVTEDTSNGIHVNSVFNDKELNLRDKIWAQVKHLYDIKAEQNLYISQGSELGKKLEVLQRGYKASNNEDYAEIVNIMQMDWGFFDDNKKINVESLIKQYKSGEPIEYCRRRNAEIDELSIKEGYVMKPEDIKYTCYGQIDRWPVTLLYDLLYKLGIGYTKQSLNNELKYANEFVKKKARCPMKNGETCDAWCRTEDTPVNKFNGTIDNESEGSNKIQF